MKWVDNKVVTMASFMGMQPLGTEQRFDRKQNKKVNVRKPIGIKNYNKHMSGVDVGDMLILLYRTSFKPKRYYLRIFAYILDRCICNSWLLAHRNATLLSERYKKPLKKFRKEIFTSLLLKKNVPNRVRPSADSLTPLRKIRRPQAMRPQEDVHYDKKGHWTIHIDKKRC